ncbi:unnamed protein product [Nesidiocoris tenuis]|uniref:Uncharacterized protein n=1 Tax=Nesidiocoris tenuis TaxID=355587 RepID=A0A6H5HJM9_9HEMI|nr:unnamed protein product [Nesidiocoris tenuis]
MELCLQSKMRHHSIRSRTPVKSVRQPSLRSAKAGGFARLLSFCSRPVGRYSTTAWREKLYEDFPRRPPSSVQYRGNVGQPPQPENFNPRL